MALPNIFTAEVSNTITQRINSLSATQQALWGTMSVGQMLAHCNVTYEMVFETKHPKPNFFIQLMLKMFVKSKVVSEAPYGQNGQTAPQFIIKETKDFNIEKERLIQYIQKVQQLGEQHFDGKESLSFGTLNKTEWNNMFYKHLDHHLRQFGV
jgi:hypothetical protein